MKFKPHTYQERMIEMIDTNKSVALFAAMGLGKTVTVLTAIENRIYDQVQHTKVLILAPKLVAETTWPDEVRKWDHLKSLRLGVLSGNAASRKKLLDRLDQYDVLVMCRNNIPWLFKEYATVAPNKSWKWSKPWPFNMVVLDESSAFKNPTGVWFKTLAKIQRSGCQIVELTGTPSPKGIEDLWSQMYLLDRGQRLEDGITKFRNRWMMPSNTIRKNGVPLVVSWAPKPESHKEIMQLVSDITVSLKAEDWLKMPERVDNTIEVELSDTVMELYKEMEEDAVIKLSEKVVTAGSAGVIVGKLLQMANGRVYDESGVVLHVHSEKLEALKELVEDSTEPVLIFYSYKHDLEAIKEVLPKAIHLDNTKLVEKWNRGEIDVLLAHPASTGHGLNMQGGGNTIVWYGLPWSLELYQQANARLYRQGQKAPSVVIHHLVAKDTMDEKVLEVLGHKEAKQEDIINAVRYRPDAVAL